MLRIPVVIRVLLPLALLTASCLQGAGYAAAPAPIQSALFLKLLGFNKSLSKDAKVYVLGSDAFVAEIKKQVGAPVGSTSMLAQVDGGAALPTEKPDVLYIGDAAQAAAALKYAAENKILTITGVPEVQESGASLAVLVSLADSKPKVVLNPATSKAEGVDWNPAIMKIATVAP